MLFFHCCSVHGKGFIINFVNCLNFLHNPVCFPHNQRIFPNFPSQKFLIKLFFLRHLVKWHENLFHILIPWILSTCGNTMPLATCGRVLDFFILEYSFDRTVHNNNNNYIFVHVFSASKWKLVLKTVYT